MATLNPSQALGQMDTAKAAGIVTVSAVVVLALLRKYFGAVNVRIGS